MITLAVAQYEIQHLPSWQAYEDKIIRLVEDARGNNAQLLLLPEYAGLEIAGFCSGKTLPEQFTHIQNLLEQYQQLFLSLAKKHQIYIQPGTLPVLEKDNAYRNRAYFFSPTGKMGYQDKIYLTPFELETGLFKPGTALSIFKTELGNIGINICYDIEFPMLAKKLVHNDVHLILLPSCTERLSGLTRVSVSGRARAIELQCYVAHACLIGDAPWCEFIDINTGQSGIYCPADRGFPDNGILAQAELNIPALLFAELSWEQLAHIHTQGEMRNLNDSQQNIDHILHAINIIQMV